MAKFWIKAGKIVINAAGAPVLCATCPCQPNWCEDVCATTYYVSCDPDCIDPCGGVFAMTNTAFCEWWSGDPITDQCVASIYLFGKWLLTVADTVNSNECYYERTREGELDCPDGVYDWVSGCGDCPANVTVYS